MKKYLVTLAITALATSAFAQGTVTLANNSANLVKQWTSSTDSTAISIPANGGYVQLVAAAKGSSLTPLGTMGSTGYTASYSTLALFLAANTAWAVVDPAGLIAPQAGRFAAGGRTINNIGAAANADYFLIGWTGAATTYDAAVAGNAFIGVSSVFTTATASTTGVPAPPTPVNLNLTFGGMLVAPLSAVPEPSTFALAGLGAAAMLIFRRRK